MKTTRTILTTMLVAAIALDAAGANWTNTGSGDWFSPSNWSDTAVPTSSSDCINDVGTILIFSGTDAVAQRLILGNSAGSSGSLNMTGGSFSGRVNIGLRGNGSMTVSGGRVFSSNYCALGLYPESTGSLTITGDGVWEVTSHGLMVVQAGTGTVTIANGGELIQSSTLTVVQPYQIDGVSRFGKGTLRVENGGKLTVPNVNLGGLNARFILDGGLFVSAATASGNLVYGVYATGALEIGPRGGTISVAGGTQSVVVDLDNLAESYGGALVKKGTGTLALCGGGSFTGGYTVEEGTLSVETSGNLPGWDGGPIVVKSGATLALGAFWTAEDAAALQARATVEEGGTITVATPAGGDYEINVAQSAYRTIGGLNITNRLVKTGLGVLELTGANTIGGGVAVSCGTLVADWATSGLADTHVTVAGANSSNVAFIAPRGSAFTQPVAESGAGTVWLGNYAGIKAVDAPLTVNFGGDGRDYNTSVNAQNLTFASSVYIESAKYPIVVKNTIVHTGKHFNLFGDSANADQILVFEGGITNDSTSGTYFFDYRYGKALFPQRAGGTAYAERFIRIRSGDATYSDAVISLGWDFMAGSKEPDAKNYISTVTLKNCIKQCGGTDFVNGKDGTRLTFDGGESSSVGLSVGYNGVNGATGRLVITNNATVSVTNFYVYNGNFELHSGLLNASSVFAFGPASLANAYSGPVTALMTGGKIECADAVNFRIATSGKAKFLQTGGDISVSAFPYVGQGAGGNGEYRLHGGTFTVRTRASGGYRFGLGENGTGTVYVANGGCLTVTGDVWIAGSNAASTKGLLMLSPGGTLEASRVWGYNGPSAFVFNGGTYRANTMGEYFIDDRGGMRVSVTPLGGIIDTNGKGDFTLKRAIVSATDAEDLIETLTHRWRFDGESLADSIGSSTATVTGSSSWTNGAIRLPGATHAEGSRVNLGTGLLPTVTGRGATIELWVTPRSGMGAWARVFSTGSSSSLWLSFRKGSATGGQLSIGGFGTLTYPQPAADTMHHIALVFDPQPDGHYIARLRVANAQTGEVLTDQSMPSVNNAWNWSNIDSSNGLWLGNSHSTGDYDPAADYHDVRICHRAMTEAQLAESVANGPEAAYYLHKAGSDTLTVNSALSYGVGTAVNGGVLKLATGKTLPQTELFVGEGATLDLNGNAQTGSELAGSGTVKGGAVTVSGNIYPGGRGTIGTLHLVEGGRLASGTVVIDVGADGACDKIVSDGTIDLSALTLSLGAIDALDHDHVYTVAEAAAFSGDVNFPEMATMKGWRIGMDERKVVFYYGKGTVIVFR